MSEALQEAITETAQTEAEAASAALSAETAASAAEVASDAADSAVATAHAAAAIAETNAALLIAAQDARLTAVEFGVTECRTILTGLQATQETILSRMDALTAQQVSSSSTPEVVVVEDDPEIVTETEPTADNVAEVVPALHPREARRKRIRLL